MAFNRFKKRSNWFMSLRGGPCPKQSNLGSSSASLRIERRFSSYRYRTRRAVREALTTSASVHAAHQVSDNGNPIFLTERMIVPRRVTRCMNNWKPGRLVALVQDTGDGVCRS